MLNDATPYMLRRTFGAKKLVTSLIGSRRVCGVANPGVVPLMLEVTDFCFIHHAGRCDPVTNIRLGRLWSMKNI